MMNLPQYPNLALKRRSAQWAILLFLVVCPVKAQAGLEDRPLNTDDAYTIEKGSWSVSAGSVFLRQKNHDEQTNIVADLAYSPLQNLELGFDVPYTFLDPKSGPNENGFGDITVRPEFQFVEETDKIPALSTWAAVKTNTGDKDKGTGTGATDVSFAGNLSKKFQWPLWLHVNLGFTLSGKPEGQDVDNVFFYKTAAEYSP